MKVIQQRFPEEYERRRAETRPVERQSLAVVPPDNEERVERLRNLWRWLGQHRPPVTGVVDVPAVVVPTCVYLPCLAAMSTPARHVVFSLDQVDAIASFSSMLAHSPRVIFMPPAAVDATTEEDMRIGVAFDVTERFRLPAESQGVLRHQRLRLGDCGVDFVNDPLIVVGVVKLRVSIWKCRATDSDDWLELEGDPLVGTRVLVRPLEDDMSAPEDSESLDSSQVLFTQSLARVRDLLNSSVGQQGIESFTRCHGRLPNGAISRYVGCGSPVYRLLPTAPCG